MSQAYNPYGDPNYQSGTGYYSLGDQPKPHRSSRILATLILLAVTAGMVFSCATPYGLKIEYKYEGVDVTVNGGFYRICAIAEQGSYSKEDCSNINESDLDEDDCHGDDDCEKRILFMRMGRAGATGGVILALLTAFVAFRKRNLPSGGSTGIHLTNLLTLAATGCIIVSIVKLKSLMEDVYSNDQSISFGYVFFAAIAQAVLHFVVFFLA